MDEGDEMTNKVRLVAAAGALLLLGACSSETSSNPGSTSDTCIPVDFEVRNARDIPLYVQDKGYLGQAFLELVRDGQRTAFRSDCGICPCQECPSCAVCGRAIATVALLQPGESRTWQWTGCEYNVVPLGCRADLDCEQPVPAARGSWVARGHYALSVTGDEFLPDTWLKSPFFTSEVTFENPPPGLVVVELE